MCDKESQMNIFAENHSFEPLLSKFGRCGSNVIKRGQSKMTAKPVKYIVPGICDRDTKKGKFAKQISA